MSMSPIYRRRLIWYLLLAFFLLMFVLSVLFDHRSQEEIERDADREELWERQM